MRGDALIDRIIRAWRRTGADLPGGDPRPTHGAEMEGWFWRFTDASRGRVVVALCGINRHRDGDWATVAVAVDPGAVVRSTAVDGAYASPSSYEVTVPAHLHATEESLEVFVDDVQLRVGLHDLIGWPMRLGAGGVFSAMPFLGQYWHPHALGGRAAGDIVVGDRRWSLDGAAVYAEKNWGAGFPDRWWWGQAQGFADPTLCVAFGGGRLRAGPLAMDVTGCVLRHGDQVIRFAPPLSVVRTSIAGGRWRVTARRRGWQLSMDADGAGSALAVLPVPIPDDRRNVNRDFQHLAGRVHVLLHRAGSVVVDAASPWAGLEVGSTDRERAHLLADEFGQSEARGAGATSSVESHLGAESMPKRREF